MKILVLALGVVAFDLAALHAEDCACAAGGTEPDTHEYCPCEDPIEISAIIKTTCNNEQTGCCETNFVVRNDGVNPPKNPSGPGEIDCKHGKHFDVMFGVTLQPKNDSPTAGDFSKSSSEGSGGGGYNAVRAVSAKGSARAAEDFRRGTPMWRVGLGQDSSGNPSGQIRIEPKGLYSDLKFTPGEIRVGGRGDGAAAQQGEPAALRIQKAEAGDAVAGVNTENSHHSQPRATTMY